MNRALILLLLLSVGACAADPAALGITGPARPAATPAYDPTQGALMAPDVTGSDPTTEVRPVIDRRFWGYN
jgi:hypothetical protein